LSLSTFTIKIKDRGGKNTLKSSVLDYKHRTKKRKEGGFDIGINNLGALFINDKTSDSVLICGKKYKAYNNSYNRFNSKLNESISEQVREWKEITKNDGETTEIPLNYTLRGKELIDFKRFLTEKRARFFESEWHKIAANIVKYCLKNGVTDFVLSRNLSFAKTTGEIKQRKAQKQTFYQIPFGDLLNKIEEKCKMVGIHVHDEDEAYTSRTSCIKGNVNKNQANRKNNKPILATDLNGSRVERGLFRDNMIGKVFNADIGGAVNHIKVAFKRLKFDWLENYLFKLSNPIKLKSTVEFDNYLLNRCSG
jgi:putative transposase